MFDLETIVAMNAKKPTAKPQRPVSVGLNNCTGKVFHFSTIADAEEALALLDNGTPADVSAGSYFIDAPETVS